MNYSYSILYILIIMSNKIMTYKYTMDSVKISKGGGGGGLKATLCLIF